MRSCRPLLRILLALVLLGSQGFLMVRLFARLKWAAMENRVLELVDEAKRRPAFRPVLRGEAEPGEAWDDYRLALEAAGGIRNQESGKLWSFLDRDSHSDESGVASILESHGAIVGHLRAGARKTRAKNPWFLAALESDNGHPYTRWIVVTGIAVCEARFLGECGRERESVDLLLAVCQYGLDLGNNGDLFLQYAATIVHSYAFAELRDELLAARWSPEQWRDLEGALEALDRRYLDHAVALRNEAALIGATLLRKGPMALDDSGLDRPLRPAEAWTCAFSTRLAAAAAFLGQEERTTRLAACDGRSWSELRAVSRGVQEEERSSRNPLVVAGVAWKDRFSGDRDWDPSATSARQRKAQLRLLRLAAHYRATGEILKLGDPFGTELFTAPTPNGLRAWSIGQDGVDNGGSGLWKPRPTGDIVLEIER